MHLVTSKLLFFVDESLSLYDALLNYYNLKDIPSDLVKYISNHTEETIKVSLALQLEIDEKI